MLKILTTVRWICAGRDVAYRHLILTIYMLVSSSVVLGSAKHNSGEVECHLKDFLQTISGCDDWKSVKLS